MGKSTGKQTTTTELPPEVAKILTDNYAFAQKVADRDYQPYSGQLVADLSPAQQSAATMMTNLAGGKDDGSQALGRAIVGAQNVMNYDIGKNAIDVDPTAIAQGKAASLAPAATGDASMAKAAQLGDPTQYEAVTGKAPGLGDATMMDATTGKAAALAPAAQVKASLADPASMMDAARIDPSKVSDVGTQNLTDLNLKQYMNPYDDQVVAQGTKDLDRARQLVENDIGSQASHVGAAFGSRQAVAEAENNRNFMQQVAQLSAQNRQAGYGQAANLAESDLGRQLQADQTQQSTDLALRNANAGFQQQANATNAGAANSLSQFNAGQKQQAGLANQADTNQFRLQDTANNQAMRLANLGYENAASSANQTAQNQFALQQGSDKQAMSLANLGYQNQAAATNAATANQFAGQNAANQQQTNLTNAGAKNDYGLANLSALNNFALQQGANQQQMNLANMAAVNQGNQFNTSTDLSAQGQNAANKLTNEQLNLSGANSLADMGLNKQKMGLADVQGLLGIGQMQQDQQQQQLDSAYQQFLNEWNYPIQQLQILQGGAQPLTQIGQTSTTSGTSSPWSTIGNILGSVGMFAMSDARLKSDIETEAYDRKGRRWVSWRYLWDGPDAPRRFGVIAQEVERTDPDAVSLDDRGFRRVDYAKLLEAA